MCIYICPHFCMYVFIRICTQTYNTLYNLSLSAVRARKDLQRLRPATDADVKSSTRCLARLSEIDGILFLANQRDSQCLGFDTILTLNGRSDNLLQSAEVSNFMDVLICMRPFGRLTHVTNAMCVSAFAAAKGSKSTTQEAQHLKADKALKLPRPDV